MMMFQRSVISVLKMINKDMLIGECITKYPETAEFLLDEGIHCVGCFAANFETIEQGLRGHGKTKEEVKQIIMELNNLIENE